MKIGIIGYGFVGRATHIFAKNYFSKEKGNVERFEVLPDTVTTPAKPNSVMTHSADGTPASHSIHPTTSPYSNVIPSQGGGPTPFFKRMFFKPIDVLIYDVRPEACQPPGITLQELDRECDLLFFCLPTPLNHDGTCYTKILEEAISRCSNPYKIIRSTIPVGFAARHGCYFMPEFLTEARWENDFRSMKEWIVGIPMRVSAAITATNTESSLISAATLTNIRREEFKRRVSKLINRSHKNGAIDSNIVVFCDTNEAEMLKLMKNCFLSAKVGLMNEFYDFSQATQTDFTEVVKLAKLDARMGTSHFQVPGPDGRRGFGGTCFPKDTHSLYCQMNARGMNSKIYPAILDRNDTQDRPERDWARDVWRTTIPLPTPQSKVVVVFTNTTTTTNSVPSVNVSSYFNDIIRTNLSKHNVVIQIVRDTTLAAMNPLGVNHLIKYWPSPTKPLFFPRVDECYYTPYQSIDEQYTSHDIARDVLCIVDLWKSHEEMILYVVKHAKDADADADADARAFIEGQADDDADDESGTEGFDDDDNDDDHVVHKTTTTHNRRFDYARIFEDYYHDAFERTNRRLVIMF